MMGSKIFEFDFTGNTLFVYSVLRKEMATRMFSDIQLPRFPVGVLICRGRYVFRLQARGFYRVIFGEGPKSLIQLSNSSTSSLNVLA